MFAPPDPCRSKVQKVRQGGTLTDRGPFALTLPKQVQDDKFLSGQVLNCKVLPPGSPGSPHRPEGRQVPLNTETLRPEGR